MEYKNGAWIEYNVLRNISRKVSDFAEKTLHKIETELKLESVSEWMKAHGIQKYRKPHIHINTQTVVEVDENKWVEEVLIEKRRITDFWHPLVQKISDKGEVVFFKNDHVGKLRGAHIAKEFHKDLRKLGIESEVIFKGSDTIVRRKGN